jgi:hypothetical protein
LFQHVCITDPEEFDGDFTFWRSNDRTQLAQASKNKAAPMPNSKRQTGGVKGKIDPRRNERQQQNQGSETESSDWRFIALAPENNGNGGPLTSRLQRAVKNAANQATSDEPEVAAAPSGINHRLPRVNLSAPAAARQADDDSISSGAFNVMAYPVQGVRPPAAAVQPPLQRNRQQYAVEAGFRPLPVPARQYLPQYRQMPGVNGGLRPVSNCYFAACRVCLR